MCVNLFSSFETLVILKKLCSNTLQDKGCVFLNIPVYCTLKTVCWLMWVSQLKQYVSAVVQQGRWTYFTHEHRLTEGTSCDCICEEAVGQLEELPALCRVVVACCVGITWQARSIVWKEDVLWCCLGSGPGHTAYDARKLSLAGPKESGWSIPLLLWVVAWYSKVVSRAGWITNLYQQEKVTSGTFFGEIASYLNCVL